MALVTSLGQCEQESDRLDAGLAGTTGRFDPLALVECVRLHKVVPQVHATLTRLRVRYPEAGDLADLLTRQFPYISEQEEAKAARMALWRSVIAMTNEKQIRMICAKGVFFHATSTYPKGSLRHFAGDLDVLVPTWAEAWRLWHELRQMGFGLDDELQAWLRGMPGSNASQAAVGQFLFSKETPHGKVVVDCHVGSLTVGLTGTLKLDLFERARCHRWENVDIWIPTPEDNLLIFVAHAYNHGYFTLKDINDIYALVRAHPKIDWGYVEQVGRENALLDGLRFILGKVCREYPPELAVPPSLRGPDRPSAARWSHVHGLTRPVSGRVPLHCLYTYKFERPLSGRLGALRLSLRQAVHNVRTHAAASGNRALLRLANRLAGVPGNLLFPAPTRYQQVFLFPIEIGDSELPQLVQPLDAPGWKVTELEPGMVVVRDAGAELVVTPVGLFVPSVTMELTPGQIERVMALASAVVEKIYAP